MVCEIAQLSVARPAFLLPTDRQTRDHQDGSECGSDSRSRLWERARAVVMKHLKLFVWVYAYQGIKLSYQTLFCIIVRSDARMHMDRCVVNILVKV